MTKQAISVNIDNDFVPFKRREMVMCTNGDLLVGDPVEIVASSLVTPRVQQMLERHGRYYIFDGVDTAQGFYFATSDYGRAVFFPINQVIVR